MIWQCKRWMMRKLYKEGEKYCSNLWNPTKKKVNDMRSEWYGGDDMKNEVVIRTNALTTRPRWLNDAKDEWLYLIRKKKNGPNLQFPNISLLENIFLVIACPMSLCLDLHFQLIRGLVMLWIFPSFLILLYRDFNILNFVSC